MKIDPLQKNSITPSKKDTKASEKDVFEKHLQDAINTGPSTKTVENKAIEMHGINPLLNITRVSDEKNQSILQLEKTFSSLDLYQNALQHSHIRYEQMEVLVQEMNSGKNELVTQMSKMPENDPLKGIMKETALLIITETNRYYRSSTLSALS